MGSGSRCGGCSGLLACDEATCAGCALWGGWGRGAGASRATGGGGVRDIAVEARLVKSVLVRAEMWMGSE